MEGRGWRMGIKRALVAVSTGCYMQVISNWIPLLKPALHYLSTNLNLKKYILKKKNFIQQEFNITSATFE